MCLDSARESACLLGSFNLFFLFSFGSIVVGIVVAFSFNSYDIFVGDAAVQGGGREGEVVVVAGSRASDPSLVGGGGG